MIASARQALGAKEWYTAQVCADAVRVQAEEQLMLATDREPWHWFLQASKNLQSASLRYDIDDSLKALDQLSAVLRSATPAVAAPCSRETVADSGHSLSA